MTEVQDPDQLTYASILDANGFPELPDEPTDRDLAAAILFSNEYKESGGSASAFAQQCADSVPEVTEYLRMHLGADAGDQAERIERILNLADVSRQEYETVLAFGYRG